MRAWFRLRYSTAAMAEFALACILWARAEVASWQSHKNKRAVEMEKKDMKRRCKCRTVRACCDCTGRKQGDTRRHHMPAQDARARMLREEAVALTFNFLWRSESTAIVGQQ
jgi:hypothetical protein